MQVALVARFSQEVVYKKFSKNPLLNCHSVRLVSIFIWGEVARQKRATGATCIVSASITYIYKGF